MISKEAISYDLRQLSSLVLGGEKKEASDRACEGGLGVEALLRELRDARRQATAGDYGTGALPFEERIERLQEERFDSSRRVRELRLHPQGTPEIERLRL